MKCPANRVIVEKHGRQPGRKAWRRRVERRIACAVNVVQIDVAKIRVHLVERADARSRLGGEASEVEVAAGVVDNEAHRWWAQLLNGARQHCERQERHTRKNDVATHAGQ